MFLLLTASHAAADTQALSDLAATAEALCAEDADAHAMGSALGAELTSQRRLGPPAMPHATRLAFETGDGTLTRVLIAHPGGMMRRFVIESHAAERPESMVALDPACALTEARHISYNTEGHAEALHVYGADLLPAAEPEPLNPPMPRRPPDARNDGVIVALFDSGLAYDLDGVAARLVYDDEGRALGHDFWDMDDRPYDLDTARSPFLPARHGTRVASVVMREAPDARVVPFRYPRPDMSRMADMVAAAAEAGARIVSMPMGSNRAEDWQAFAEAATAHPELLFVLSAGNDGRDLDEEPLWPASLGLDNALVVTSADEAGRLAPGSNWGAESVDLMVPAEDVAIFDHRGITGRGAGTSYAVPRVAALAARLLKGNPDMGSMDLKQAILDRAMPTDAVRHGFIADPAE